MRSYLCLYTVCPEVFLHLHSAGTEFVSLPVHRLSWGVPTLTFCRCWVRIAACTSTVMRCSYTYILEVLSSYRCLYIDCPEVFLHLHSGGAEVVSLPAHRLSQMRCFFTYILEVLSSYLCLYTAYPEVISSLWSVVRRTFQSGVFKKNTKASHDIFVLTTEVVWIWSR